jgi:hypothetical protein
MAQQQQQQQHHQQRQEIVYLGGHELGILEKLEPLGSGSFAQVYALRERGELRAGKVYV